MKKYGILAYPAGHSLSPVMHNAAFKAAGISAQYGVFEIPENALADFMKSVIHEPINGLSVSLPHKEMVMQYLNEVSEDCKLIGACNTVNNEGGFLHGYNTDSMGACRALSEVVGDLSGSRVIVLGAGGASRAICYGLLRAGARVTVCDRYKEKADMIASEYGEIFGEGIESVGMEEISTSGVSKNPRGFISGDILVQATSIWMLEENLNQALVDEFVPEEFVNGFNTVMDIVYKPLMTPLLERAEGLGKKIITGEKMLLYQAVAQFEIWTGDEAPVEVMKEALMDMI